MIVTHESGSQEDQFDEKKWRQKISWDYPFKNTVKRFYVLKALHSYSFVPSSAI
jgi:hypothetical protein